MTQDTSQSTTTSGSGAFALSNLAAGNYTLRVSKLGYQPRDIAFAITAGQTTSLGSVTLRSAPLTAGLSGVVRNSSGALLRDVLISVGTSSALTDVNGAYQITGLNPGSDTVTATLSGYQTITTTVSFVGGTSYVFSPTLVAVGQPSTSTSLKGVVVDQTTRSPITGATVVIGAVSKTTGVDGLFEISGLNTGTFSAAVSATGYASLNLSGTLVLGVNDAGKIVLSKAANTSSTAILSGVIKNASNQGLNGVLVRVGTLTATTAPDGSYQIIAIPAGSATITATLTGYQSVSTSVTFVASGSYVFSPILYANGVTPPGTLLKGSIVDSVSGSAIAGASVVLGAVTKTTPTNGTFEFTNLNTGSFSVAVNATGYTSASFTGTLVGGANDVGKIQLVKAPLSNTLTGVIKDAATKAPVAGAVVAVQGLSTTATSGNDGSYTITGITGASLTLTVTANNYVTRQLSVTLPQLGTSTLDIEITKPALSKLSFEFVRTMKPTYNPDELVRLEVEVKNTDAAAVPLLVEADVFDSTNRVVYTFLANSRTGWAGTRLPNQPVTIPAAGALDVPMEWVMLRQAAGNYTVRARGIDTNGSVVAEGQTTFAVNAAAILRGGVTPNPPLAQFGTNQPIALTADLTNTGNTPIPPGNLDVKIVLDNPDTQTSTIPLTTAKTFVSGAPLSSTRGLVIDAAGNQYTVNSGDYKLLKIDPVGVVSVITTLSPSFGPAVDLALGANGDIWVLRTNGRQITRVEASGALSNIEYSSLDAAKAIDVAPNGDLVLTGSSYATGQQEDRLIRRTPAGVETVLWKNGLSGPVAFVKDDANSWVVTNYSDNTLTKVSIATGAVTPFATGFNRPQGITKDAAGNFYVANTGGNSISKVTSAGVVSTYAAGLVSPFDLKFDASGNLFVSNQDDNSIAKVPPNGIVEIFARGIANGPQGMKYDSAGNLWIANNDGTLRKNDSADVVSIVATGLTSPRGLAINSTDEVFVANYGSGTINKISGSTKSSFVASLASPYGVAFDNANNLWVTEYGASRIKQFDAAGTLLKTIESPFSNPDLVVIGTAGEQYVRNSGYISVVENGVPRIFFKSPSIGLGRFAVDPIAGGLVMLSGQNVYRISSAGVATKITTTALPFYPYDIGVDAAGGIVLADYSAKTVQRLSAGVVTPLAVLPEYFQTLFTDLLGQISVVTNGNKLYRVEANGSFAEILTPGITDYVYGRAASGNGKILVKTYPKLYEVDRATGASTLIAADSVFYSTSSIARDTNGKLYGVFGGGQDFVTYDAAGTKLSVISGFTNPKDIVWTGSDFRFTDGGYRLYSLSGTGVVAKIGTTFYPDFLAIQGANLLGLYSSSIYRWTGSAQETYASVPSASLNGGIAANGTSLAVADSSNSRIIVLDNTKAVVADYAGLVRPRGLAFDSVGKLYVANNSSSLISRFEPTGKASTVFAKVSNPNFLAFDPSGKLWATNNGGSQQIDASGAVSTPITQSGGLLGIGFDGLSTFAMDYNQSIFRKLDLGTWKPFAAGFSAPVSVRVSANNEIFVANQRNGTVVKYAAGKLSTSASGLASPNGIDVSAGGILYVAGTAGSLTQVNTDGTQRDMRVASLVGNAPLNAVSVAPNGKLYAAGSVYNPVGRYDDTIFEFSVTQAVTPPAAGTVVYTGQVPMSALAASDIYANLDLSTWLPPYGGDFRVEVSRAGVVGGATNYIHVGAFAKSQLAASKTELPPGDQSLTMCMKLEGADFTSISRVETAQVRPVASFDFPKGLAGDKTGNVYYTNAASLFQVSQGQTTGTQVATGMNLSFGLAADNDENFYVASKNATTSNFELIKITKAGEKTVVANLGVTQANGVQVDSKGDVLVGSPNKLLKVTKAGVVSTVTTAGLPSPRGIAIDGRDNVYVQNENNFVSMIKPDGSAFDIFSKGDGVNEPAFEGDGYPNIAADCGENFYIAPYHWEKIGQTPNEEHTLGQVVARTGRIATLFDALKINPILNDIDYLAFDRLGNRILLWNHYEQKVWSVPVTCGAIGVQAHLVTQAGQKLSGISKAPAAIIPLADGRTEYVWSLKDVTVQGEQVCFDTTQTGLKLGELRKTLDSGYVTFQNSFSSNDVKVPLDIPSVRAGNLVSLAVATDKGDYPANVSATVTTTLTNAFTRVIGGTLTVEVFDSKGILVGSVTQQGVSIPASGELPVVAPFPIGRIVPAKYTVKAVLVDNGVAQARAQSDFNVLPDNVNASAISAVSTDRRVYNPSDRVVIASRANSQSANIVLENLTLMVRVYDSGNALMLTYGHAIAQLLPGAQRDFTLPQALKNVPAGQYTVRQELQDTQGRVLDTRQTAYAVGTSADTGFGLVGTIAATPKQVRPGETLNLASTATNNGNAALTNLPLKVLIVDPDLGTVVTEYPTTASSIAAGASFTLPGSIWTAAGRTNATYLAVLTATIGTGTNANQLTLATDTLQVLPQIAAGIIATGGTPQSATITQSYPVRLEATVRDTVNNPLPGVTVSFAAPSSGASVSFPSGNTAVTDAQGRASVPVTANGTVGAVAITATTPNTSGQANFALTNKAPTASSLVVTSGTPQSTNTNSAFQSPLVATVRDNLNNPIAGVVVSFTAANAGTTSNPANLASASFPAGNTAVTGANGQASITAKANAAAGSYVVSASASAAGVTGVAEFNLSNILVCTRAQPVSFAAVKDAPKSTLMTSNSVTVTGLGTGCTTNAAITSGAFKITRSGVNVTKASVGFSTAPQTLQDGDTITLEQTTSAQEGITTTASLTLDGQTYPWAATTAGAAQAVDAQPVPLLPEQEPARSLMLALLALLLAGAAVVVKQSHSRRGRNE